jgi:long-chain acyl-CoA synthetase
MISLAVESETERRQGAMQRQSLIEYLDKFYERGSEIAYVGRRGYRVARWSYREIAETASQFASELEARGIAKSDHVVIWGPNCPEWVAAFFGCALRGAVVVPIDFIATADFARRVAKEVDAKLLVRSREFPSLDPELPVIVLEVLREDCARRSGTPYLRPTLGRDDPLEIVFTSGTTSDPKGIVISHGNFLANLEPLENEISKYLKLEHFFHPLRFLHLVPLSHVFGQFLGLFVSPLLVATVIFQDSLNPLEIIRSIKRERVSVLVTVPRLLESLEQKIKRDFEIAGRREAFEQRLQAAEGKHFTKRWWRFRDIHRRFGWKFWAFISGGAALDPESESFWRRLGFAVVQGYGMTETTSLVSVNHPFRLGQGSIGKALPGMEIKLDVAGEILVRGDNVATGYWQGRELKPVVDPAGGNDGWFHTGDLGEMDAQGNLFFKGRKKDVIVTAEGMKVYPEDLEAALRRVPEVRDCSVVGMARVGNAEPCAVLILRDPHADLESIIHRANATLAGYQQIRRWFVWHDEDFPRTSTQKPRTHVIQEFVRTHFGARDEGRESLAGHDGTLAEVIGRIRGLRPDVLKPGANLATDLNLSSIDRVELLSALEDRYQIDLNETEFAAATTVAELEKIIHAPAASETRYGYPRWAQRWPVTWIRLAVYYLLSWPATLLLGYPRIRGRENLRGTEGPVLIVSNHVTSIDIGFILAALPARLRHHVAVAMIGERLNSMRRPPAGTGLFKRWFDRINYALVVALFNVFPLPQKSGFRESFEFAGASADRGYSVVVFPEGRRTKDGKLAPFRAGIGLLAARLDLPVIPVRLDGLFELKQQGKRVARPHAVSVTLGSPMRFDQGAEPESIARELEKSVASLGE